MKSIARCSILIALMLQACAAQQGESREEPPARPNEPTAAPAPAAPAAVAAPSNTWYAVRVVRVSTSNDEETARAGVQEAISSEFLQRMLVEEELNPQLIRAISATSGQVEGREAVDVEIIVDLSQMDFQTQPVAREVADAVVEGLRQRLVELSQGTLGEHQQRIEAERARATEDLAKSRAELTALRAKLREATGRSDASAERIRDELSRMEDSREEIQLELETRAARMKALSDNIAKITAQVEQRVQSDAVAAELEKIVEARAQKAERIKQALDKGTASRGDYDEALAQEAEARARLLDRRAQAASAAGADSVDSWNHELMKLSVDLAELQARLDGLSSRIGNYQKVVDDLDNLDSLAETREHATEMLQETRQQLREIERRLASTRPPKSVVTISQDKSGPVPQSNAQGDSQKR